MPTPGNPFGYFINVDYLAIGAVVGLAAAFAMWRWRLRRAVTLVPITLIVLVFWSPLYLPAALVAIAVTWVGGYLPNGEDENLLSLSHALGLVVGRLSLRIPQFKWKGWVLLAANIAAVIGLHEASRISISVLAFMSAQLAGAWWLSTHLQDGRFNRNRGILTPHGMLSIVLGLAQLVDELLREHWLKHRRAMVVASAVGSAALYKMVGDQAPQVVIWIWLLCIAWGAGKCTTL